MYNHRAVMADIYENRRARLRQLVEERFEGNRSRLGRAAGLNSSHFVNIFSGRYNLGERNARQIEAMLGLPDSWMDRKPPADPENPRARGRGAAAATTCRGLRWRDMHHRQP